MGWSRLENGDLLRASEEAGFEVMVTCDIGFRLNPIVSALPLKWIEQSPVPTLSLRFSCGRKAGRSHRMSN
jgi:hypothetical protein